MRHSSGRAPDPTGELAGDGRLLRVIVDCAPLAVVGSTPDREIVLWNRAAEELFGWRRSEVQGGQAPIVPEDWQAELDGLLRALDRGERVTGLNTVRVRKDGTRVDVSLSAVLVRPTAGAPAIYLAMYLDITERVRTLRRLGVRERQQAAVAALGQLALREGDLEHLFEEAVRQVADALGVELVEVLELLPDRDALRLVAGVGWRGDEVGRAIVPGGRGSQAGYTLASGEPVVVEDLRRETRFEPPRLLLEHGVVSGITALIRGRPRPFGVLGAHSRERREFSPEDVVFLRGVANVLAQAVGRAELEKERQRALERERAAREEAERHAREEAALREATRAVVAQFTIDEMVRQIAASALTATNGDGALVEQLALERGEVEIVAAAGELVPPVGARAPYRGSAAEYVVERGEPAILGGVPEADAPLPEHLSRHCPGCTAVVVPLMDGDEALGALLVTRRADRPMFRPDEIVRADTFGDLASLAFRRVNLLDAAETRRIELERATEWRTRIVRGFSHDLKNPLGAARGQAELLLSRALGELTPRQEEGVTRIHRSIGAALELIEDVVTLAQAEAGQMAIEWAAVDVRTTARDVAAEYRAIAEAKSIGMDLEVPAEMPAIESDANRVRQILGNLISNAVKYTPEGGRIVVGVGLCDADAARAAGVHVERSPYNVELRMPVPERWVCITVRDTGPGIPRDKQELIFEEFTRLERGTERGAGLGLAISRRVARALGGDITVESEPGSGATFTVWLPLREARGDVVAPASPG